MHVAKPSLSFKYTLVDIELAGAVQELQQACP